MADSVTISGLSVEDAAIILDELKQRGFTAQPTLAAPLRDILSKIEVRNVAHGKKVYFCGFSMQQGSKASQAIKRAEKLKEAILVALTVPPAAPVAPAPMETGSAGTKFILTCRNCGHVAQSGEWVGIVGCSKCTPDTFVATHTLAPAPVAPAPLTPLGEAIALLRIDAQNLRKTGQRYDGESANAIDLVCAALTPPPPPAGTAQGNGPQLPSCASCSITVDENGVSWHEDRCPTAAKPSTGTPEPLRESIQAIVNRWDGDTHEYSARVIIMQLKALLAAVPQASPPNGERCKSWLHEPDSICGYRCKLPNGHIGNHENGDWTWKEDGAMPDPYAAFVALAISLRNRIPEVNQVAAVTYAECANRIDALVAQQRKGQP